MNQCIGTATPTGLNPVFGRHRLDRRLRLSESDAGFVPIELDRRNLLSLTNQRQNVLIDGG